MLRLALILACLGQPPSDSAGSDAASGESAGRESVPSESVPKESAESESAGRESAESKSERSEWERSDSTGGDSAQSDSTEGVAPPAPTVTPMPESSPTGAPRPRRIHRCLPGAQPCYRTTSARFLLGGLGGLTSVAALASVFVLGDRQSIGDPAIALTAAGFVALSAASIGGTAAGLGGDGPAVPDRITPPTLGLSLGVGGTSTVDERAPYSLSGTFAPTLEFPHDQGRLRVIGRFGGDLGTAIDRDPRPQHQLDDNGDGGRFAQGLARSRWDLDIGLDLAVRLPYPSRRTATQTSSHPGRLGQFELRYKPLFYVARERLTLAGDERRVSQRVALMPLNVGFRWNVSPRQRFTMYLGPRWDLNGYGEPDDVRSGAPEPAPIYGEAWFDLDIPIAPPAASRRARVVAQFTLGYLHSRLPAPGLDLGAVVGFIGHAVGQFSVRVRPLGSPVAYQFALGARAGQGVHPFLQAGIVLPSLVAKSRSAR